MSYRAAAEQVAGWLVSTAERSPQGWCWPLQPGVAPDVEHGLGWGTAGPVLFFVEAFRTTDDERWLAAAREGRDPAGGDPGGRAPRLRGHGAGWVGAAGGRRFLPRPPPPGGPARRSGVRRHARRRPAGTGDQRPLGDVVVEPRVPPAGAG